MVHHDIWKAIIDNYENIKDEYKTQEGLREFIKIIVQYKTADYEDNQNLLGQLMTLVKQSYFGSKVRSSSVKQNKKTDASEHAFNHP